MDAVLLDTDVFSYLLKRNDDRGQLYRPHVKGKTVAVSFVTVGELYVWATKRNWGPTRLTELETRLKSVVIVPFDLPVCKAYATISALKTPAGTDRVIAANDRWIAACAIRHGIPIITNNRRHFEDIPGLTVISEAPQGKQPKPQTLKGLGDAEPNHDS
jgi:predicted nucleic acid-binding protein